MRHSLRRIVFQSSQNSVCIRCRKPQLFVTYRKYSTDGATSSSTLADNPELILTESTTSPSSPLPSSTSLKPKEAWHFRLPPPKMDSKTRQNELTRALSQTSLRKKVHWFPPLMGVNPAYDLALTYLEQDRQKKIEIIEQLETRIAEEQESTPFPS